ncbi:TetR/AcrR family transcriptional regulator [Amycolatopsis echigonensis]|uniref:TetR family transcriptional regulator n=2 Tax=Amycolatopsis echigonensis TaxID=2576905 RepID=A0A2N3WMZ2_9PSEU|nr:MULTISPECIES: TetR/AcrR family transcriptional regulator [Amycolatopsis]PKV95240.1 TetR family transcriptional regulator [Amycolatopsis niigatensis]
MDAKTGPGVDAAKGKRRNKGELLVQSMQELLWERGYAGATPAEVQRRAGAGQGSMYHFFRGKAELARAAELGMGEDLKREVEQRFAGRQGLLERIEAYLAPDGVVTRGCRLGRLVQEEEVARSPELMAPIAETYGWIQGRLEEVLAEGVERGELRPDVDVQALAVTILAIRQGAYALARLADSDEPFRQSVKAVSQLLETARPAV